MAWFELQMKGRRVYKLSERKLWHWTEVCVMVIKCSLATESCVWRGEQHCAVEFARNGIGSWHRLPAYSITILAGFPYNQWWCLHQNLLHWIYYIKLFLCLYHVETPAFLQSTTDRQICELECQFRRHVCEEYMQIWWCLLQVSTVITAVIIISHCSFLWHDNKLSQTSMFSSCLRSTSDPYSDLDPYSDIGLYTEENRASKWA